MKFFWRKFLFLTFSLLFFIISPLLIIYALGYKFDFQEKKFKKTGGLYVQAIPREVNIILNGKLIKKTDKFSGTALVRGLLPREYEVEIKKDGYRTWKKKIRIEEGKVTEVKKLTLFLEKISFEKLEESVEDFWFNEMQNSLILKKRNENMWYLEMKDLETNEKKFLLSEKDLGKGSQILEGNFSENFQKFFLKIKKGDKVFKVSFLLSEKPKFFLEENGVKEKTFKKGNFIFLKDERGDFWRENVLFGEKEKLLENVNDFLPSPDKKKILAQRKGELWLFSIDENLEKDFLLRFSEEISQVFWLNSENLIFTVGNFLKITETDTRDGINVYDIAYFKNPKFTLDRKKKKVYLLSENNLFVANKILP